MRICPRALLTLVLLLPASVARAGAPPDPGPSSGTLVDVPYFTQTEQLCGGAALAMVLRYWGAPDVFPQDFAALIEPEAGGIRTGRLTQAVRDRGWTATAVAAGAESGELLQQHVTRGRPLIALVEDRPGVHHYVVIVGVTDEAVVWHDPARAPYQVIDRAAFERAWTAAGRWMLLVLPPGPDPGSPANTSTIAAPVVRPVAVTSSPVAGGTCGPLVAEAVTHARAGRRLDAERRLRAATSLCPAEAAGWRELAGLRLIERRFAESTQLAQEATRRSPADRNAWQVLAASRYAAGDQQGALDAWNEVGLPLTDLLTIAGVEHMPQPTIVNQIGLPARALLTRASLVRAERRLEELPSVSKASIRYEMLGDGRATISAAIDERSVLPKGLAGWGAVGVGAAFQKEIRVGISSPLGLGERWIPSYRWSSRRPRVKLEIETPAPAGWPGVVRLETFWERQTYQHGLLGESPLEQSRRRAGVTVGTWASDWLRWEGGAGVDTIDDEGFVSFDAALNTRWLNDSVALMFTASRWVPTGNAAGFSSAEIYGAWRSTRETDAPRVTAVLGVTAVSDDAPLAVWPGASSGLGRGALLRAHPVLENDILIGSVFGRRLAFSSIEYERPVWRSPYGGVGVAGFIDTARAWNRIDPTVPSSLHADIGAGARLSSPGAGGTVRLDLAYGLRDGKLKLSAGYVVPWGRR